jgi:hypothetical protein
MKATSRTQRRNASQTGPGISLFPFLAVLICTMGALVPLMLVISRTARLQAEAAAIAKANQQGSELQTQREDVQWRITQLQKSRARTELQMADARLELGHIEDHSRRLRDQLAQYEKTIGDLETSEQGDQRQLAQSQAELDRVRTQINGAQQELAQTQRDAVGRSRCYAVVPYEGPNQTRRRPIYLECREDAVVLQPEGIELGEADFDGPLGPGNPLAATLRAAREYMLAQRDFDPQAGEPYPMLLVRPEGISAYYAARAAMKSWGFDFGYELVDDGWKLAYPPPDPRLAETVRQVVASARASQARLAAAAPRRYGSRSKVAYRASPGGGFIRESRPAEEEEEDGGYASASPAGAVGAARGQGPGTTRYGRAATGDATAGNPYVTVPEASGGGRGGPTGAAAGAEFGGSGGGTPGGPALVGNGIASGGTPQGGGSGGGYPGANPSADGPYAAVAAPYGNPVRGGSEATRDGSYRSSPSDSGSAMSGIAGVSAAPSSNISGGAPSTGTSAHAGALASGDRTAAACPSSNGASVERPEGYVVGQPPRESTMANQSAAEAGAVRGRALGPGEWQPSPDPPPKKHDDKLDDKHKKNLAEKRGVDWGLRDAARGSVGVTRPIRVDCYADRLVVVSERGPAANKTVALGPRTQSSIDALVSTVWENMEAWGMAGRGMYWRPVLQFYVAPDAERRFAELSPLLDGSGMMVERK